MSHTGLFELRNQERQSEMRQFVSVCSGLLSLPLFMVFWLADLLYMPSHKWEFLAIRSIMIPVCLATNFAMKRCSKLLVTELIGTAYTFSNSITITILIFLSEGIASPYYAGLNLVASGIIPFVPWTRKFLILNVVLVYAPFFILSVVLTRDFHSWTTLAINSFFVTGTIIISLVVRYFTEQLRTKELEARLQLEQELESRERIIKQKTAEGMRLTSLTKQFSPQIVHSIRSGQLNIESIHNSKICAIFIDIVNSTDHVENDRQDHFQKVIAMFMEDAMKVLLKYDITIDKFLGDGVLGFSNDPMPRTDFQERAVDAALEVNSRILSREEEYRAYWQSKLQIRTGIATGMASVGFYGSDEYFKSYTAIGKVVNLANRLCSVAKANQILISEEIAQRLPEGYTIHFSGQHKLKGFSTDLRVYEVTKSARLEDQSKDIFTCPQGHGVLNLETNSAGIFVLSCRSCGFTLDNKEHTNSSRHAA